MNIEAADLNQIIVEETKKEINFYLLEQRVSELKSQGLSKEQIRTTLVNEGILDMLSSGLDALGEGAKQMVIERILAYIEEKMGLNPKGWFFAVLNKAIANMDWPEDFQAIISGNCERIVIIVEEALGEELLDRLITKLTDDVAGIFSKRMGIQADSLDKIVGGSIKDVARNMLADYLKEKGIIKEAIAGIADWICEIEITELISPAGTTTPYTGGAEKFAADEVAAAAAAQE